MKNIQFLAIGDIVIDAFIELLDAEVSCDIDKENCRISMRFGDKIPYKEATIVNGVGNGPNASVSASRLGLRSAIITHVGSDEHGRDCTDSLEKDNVDTSLVQIQNGKATNYHYVLSFDAERTILVRHTAFDYQFKNILDGVTPEWIYLTSLADNSLPYQLEIAEYLNSNPSIKLAFQPGTFQMKLGYKNLQSIYERSEIFFCNKEEANRILLEGGIINGEVDDIKVLLTEVRKLGPKIVVITDGPNGAYAFDGDKMYFMPIYPDPKPPVQRTGAGDAFASTLTSFLATGMSLPEALLRAPINSMHVVQYVGAQKGLLTRDEIEEWLAKAPGDYQVKEI